MLCEIQCPECLRIYDGYSGKWLEAEYIHDLIKILCPDCMGKNK
jgi:hypothetical protein